jgi:hypothetical protein
MGFKLAVVVVSAHRHCPAFVTVTAAKNLKAVLRDYEKRMSMPVALDNNICSLPSRYPVGKKGVFPMKEGSFFLCGRRQDRIRR